MHNIGHVGISFAYLLQHVACHVRDREGGCLDALLHCLHFLRCVVASLSLQLLLCFHALCTLHNVHRALAGAVCGAREPLLAV